MKDSQLINIDDLENTKISILSRIKPAATKLILESESTDLLELIKLTLFDLILKKVLVLKKEFKKLHPKDHYSREYLIIETGRNFKKYNHDKFELLFVGRIEENSYFHLISYIREIHRDIKSEYSFKKEIIQDSNISNLFKITGLSSLFKIINLNSKGNNLKNTIKPFLDNLNKNITHLFEKEPEKILDLILFLKGNIFLLTNLKFDLWDKISELYKIKMASDDDFYDNWFLTDLCFDTDFSISELFNVDGNFFDSYSNNYDFDDYSHWDASDFDFD
ncbi:hypothetical protein [uncultured Lacinutrix sp.]|uniref:hypothetical protein n=1 Tax=uncultured Lacinutrix sp. TaxID=574032 RepID=UPI00262B7E09|nr:hypothetical protein [uncultured Lacinutrix sp.]